MKVLNSLSVIPINLAEAYLAVPVSTAGKILLSAHPLDCQTNYPARSRATSSRPTAAATSNRHLLALDVQLLPLHNVLHSAPLLHVLLLLLSQLHPQHPHNPRCSQPSCLLLALLGTLYFSMAVNATKSTWIQQHTSGCRQKRRSAFQSPTSANSTRIYYSQPYLFNASSRSEKDPQQDKHSWRCPSNLQAGEGQGAEELPARPGWISKLVRVPGRGGRRYLSDNCGKVLNSA